MKDIILKLNYFLFSWYYSRVPDHFKQWTFLKSVKLLIQNYKHDQLILSIEMKASSSATKEASEARKELANLKMQMLANSGQINKLNNMFGTDFTTPEEN